MNINRNNYEAWLLDLFEGNLSPEERAFVSLFLDQNPDLKADLENFEILTIKAGDESLSSKGKGKLKRPFITPVGSINSHNYDDYFIGWHEGTLQAEERTCVTLFIEKNPGLQSEFNLFGTIYLQPQKSIVYPDKKSLKKRLIIPLYSSIGIITSIAAACIAILLIFKSFTEPTVTNESISKLQLKQFVLASINTELQMKPASGTLLHFEDVEYKMPTANPKLTLPYSENKISPAPSLRTALIITSTGQKLIPPSNEYIMLMDHIRMREEMTLAEHKNNENRKINLLAEKVLQGLSKDINDNKEDLSVLNILEYGITQYHKLTNNPVTIEKEVNAKGETNAYSISTENFGVSHRKANRTI